MSRRIANLPNRTAAKSVATEQLPRSPRLSSYRQASNEDTPGLVVKALTHQYTFEGIPPATQSVVSSTSPSSEGPVAKREVPPRFLFTFRPPLLPEEGLVTMEGSGQRRRRRDSLDNFRSLPPRSLPAGRPLDWERRRMTSMAAESQWMNLPTILQTRENVYKSESGVLGPHDMSSDGRPTRRRRRVEEEESEEERQGRPAER